MKKLALIILGLSLFLNAQESDNLSEDLDTPNKAEPVVKTRGFGYYMDASADFAFLWPTNPSSGGASSFDGTRNNSDSFLDFQLYFSIGPTYAFNEKFSLGVRVGVGIQSLMVGFHKKVFKCGGINNTNCGWVDNTSYSSIDTGFALPLALDLRYSFHKKFGVVFGGEYDIGSTMDVAKIYVGLYMHPFAIKLGWIPYSKINDRVIDQALKPSAGQTSISLGDGKSEGFFVSLSYMAW